MLDFEVCIQPSAARWTDESLGPTKRTTSLSEQEEEEEEEEEEEKERCE